MRRIAVSAEINPEVGVIHASSKNPNDLNYFIHQLFINSSYKYILSFNRCGQKLDLQFMGQLLWQD